MLNLFGTIVAIIAISQGGWIILSGFMLIGLMFLNYKYN